MPSIFVNEQRGVLEKWRDRKCGLGNWVHGESFSFFSIVLGIVFIYFFFLILTTLSLNVPSFPYLRKKIWFLLFCSFCVYDKC